MLQTASISFLSSTRPSCKNASCTVRIRKLQESSRDSMLSLDGSLV